MVPKASTERRDVWKKPEPWRWSDRLKGNESPFGKTRAAELRYAAILRKVSAQIGAIIDGYPDPLDDPEALAQIDEALGKYAELLGPWAEKVGARMVGEVDGLNERAWNTLSRTMSRELRREILTAPTGIAMREALDRQVGLIASLPRDAAERVHTLTIEGMLQGTRASEIAKEIARSGEVSQSRATLIARTEVSRTSTELTKARAEHVGSDGYVWETSRDSDVRKSHREMQGKFVAWSDPPTLDNMVGHAGCLPNCRCWPYVIVPDA